MVAKMWRGFVFTSLFISVLSLHKYSRDASSLDNCIGKSTKVLARAMLQGYADAEKNLVFSPIGYASLIAMLAEGSHGETEKEISDVLHLHRESVKQRNEFKDILSSIKEKYSTNKPQLRSWFYVYKNYSVEESYKSTLNEYYLTDVKNVYPAEFEVIAKTKDVIAEEIKMEDRERFALAEDSGNSAYVEKQIIRQAEREDELFKSGEIVQDGSVTHDSNLASGAQVEVKSQPQSEAVTSNGNSPVIQAYEPNEADEQVVDKLRAKEKLTKDKIHSVNEKTSLGIDPANFLPEALKKARQAEHYHNSLMILFNGYYFEGSWEIPFDENVTLCKFHPNSTETVNVSAITARGIFKAGEISHLNSSAISIPFQGGRYSLVIILPNEYEGLDQLVSEMNDTTLQQVLDNLEERELEVQIPQLILESTTDPGTSLKEIGVTTLFSEDSDLTGISTTGGLQALELVQLVTMRITENVGTINYMTAMSVAGRSIQEKFIANHPFLFFIEDNKFNVTVVAGKIINPSIVPL